MADKSTRKQDPDAPRLPFRVHFADGSTKDVTATSADEARALFKGEPISKIKLRKDL